MDYQLQVNGKPVNAALALPPNGKGPGVLVLHAWWGLNPYFKTLCTRIAEQGFVALAPDLYNGEVAHSVEEANALMESQSFESMRDTVIAAKDALLAHPACTSAQVGLIGFSLGASWSLFAAANAPEQVAAAVLFYGSEGMDFNKIQAKVMGHVGDMDEWEPLDGIRAMERDMRAAGLDVTIHIYPGAGHWFVEDDRPEYNPEAARLAWERTFAFLAGIFT